jgi:hypothetical protein
MVVYVVEHVYIKIIETVIMECKNQPSMKVEKRCYLQCFVFLHFLLLSKQGDILLLVIVLVPVPILSTIMKLFQQTLNGETALPGAQPVTDFA